MAALQQTGNIFVIIGQTRLAGAYHDDHICFFDGYGHLSPDFFLIRLIFQLDAAGINHPELSSEPFAFCIDTVSGHAWRIFDNRDSRSGQTVKNRRLPHIRPADDCNDSCMFHACSSFRKGSAIFRIASAVS